MDAGSSRVCDEGGCTRIRRARPAARVLAGQRPRRKGGFPRWHAGTKRASAGRGARRRRKRDGSAVDCSGQPSEAQVMAAGR